MCRTVAALVVRSPKAFAWLGHRPALGWSLCHLKDVRGIDRIVCCVTRPLAARAAAALCGEEVETHVIPDAVARQGDVALDRWLCAPGGPAAGAGAVVVVPATTPFLPAPKIEACLDLVSRGFVDSCLTARPVRALDGSGRCSQGFAEACGCRAFVPALAAGSAVTAGRFRPVPVDVVESLDVEDPGQLRFVKALIADGMAAG